MPIHSDFASLVLNQTTRNGSPSQSPARPRLPSISEVRPHDGHSPSPSQSQSHSHSHSHSHSNLHSHSHSHSDLPEHDGLDGFDRSQKSELDRAAAESSRQVLDVKRMSHLRVPRSRTPWDGNGYSLSRAQNRRADDISEVSETAEVESEAEPHDRRPLFQTLVVDSHHRQYSSSAASMATSYGSVGSVISAGTNTSGSSPYSTHPHSKTNSAESAVAPAHSHSHPVELPSFADLDKHTRRHADNRSSRSGSISNTHNVPDLDMPYSNTARAPAERMPAIAAALDHLNAHESQLYTRAGADRTHAPASTAEQRDAHQHRRTASAPAPQPMEPFVPQSSRGAAPASGYAKTYLTTPQGTPDQVFSNIDDTSYARQRSSSLYRHNMPSPSDGLPRTPSSHTSPDQAPASLPTPAPVFGEPVQQNGQNGQSGNATHRHRQSVESSSDGQSEPNFFELGNFRDVNEADGDKCVFVNYCGTGSKPRKAISHFFGRNKTCTRQIREYVWVHWCRKHYQRTRYEQKANYPLRQAKLLRAQIERVQIWGDQNRAAGRGPVLVNWTLALRKREQDRIDALKKKDKQDGADKTLGKRKRDDGSNEYYDGNDGAGGHSVNSGTNGGANNGYPDYDGEAGLDLDDIPSHAPDWLLEFVGRECDTQFLLQLIDRIEGEINAGTLPMIPDIEMLPNFEDPADASSKKKKPAKRRQTTARRAPLGHRQTQSVSGAIMHSAAHSHSPVPSFDFRQPHYPHPPQHAAFPHQPHYPSPHYSSPHPRHHQQPYANGEGYNSHAAPHSSHAAPPSSHTRYHSMGNLALAPSSTVGSNGRTQLPAIDARSFDRPAAGGQYFEHGYPPAFAESEFAAREMSRDMPRDMPREVPRSHQRSQSEAVPRQYPGHYTGEMNKIHLPPLHTMTTSDMRPASPQTLLRHARHHSSSSHMSMPGGTDGASDADREQPDSRPPFYRGPIHRPHALDV